MFDHSNKAKTEICIKILDHFCDKPVWPLSNQDCFVGGMRKSFVHGMDKPLSSEHRAYCAAQMEAWK